MGAIDNHWNKLITETIRREEKAITGHAATRHRRLASPSGRSKQAEVVETSFFSGVVGTPRPHTPGFTPRSAAVRFLEEKTGLSSTAREYQEEISQGAGERPPTRELLYHGVSSEGDGRVRYLKERKKFGVIERYGAPVTVTHTYGLIDPAMAGSKTTSAHCRKPIIQNSFFRNMGTTTYKNLPGS